MRRMKRLIGCAMVISALAWSVESQADEGCPFTIVDVDIATDGTFYVDVTNTTGYKWQWYLCSTAGSVSVNNGYGAATVTSDACKSTYTEFLTARASARPITIWFHGPTDCTSATLPASYANVNPYPMAFVF